MENPKTLVKKKKCHDKANASNCNKWTLNSEVVCVLESWQDNLLCLMFWFKYSYLLNRTPIVWVQGQTHQNFWWFKITSLVPKDVEPYSHQLEHWSFLTHIAEISRIKRIKKKKQRNSYVEMSKSVLHFVSLFYSFYRETETLRFLMF